MAVWESALLPNPFCMTMDRITCFSQRVWPAVTLLYNLLMIVMDLAALGLLARRKSIPWCLAVWFCHAIVAIGCARMLREPNFGFFLLIAWGLFLHGTVVLAGSAVVMRPTRRLWAMGSAAVALILAVIAGDALLIEPTWLEVSHLKVVSARVERPTRIVVMADIQADRIGEYERQVFRRAIEEQPDIILLAGDYLQPAASEYERLIGPFHDLVEQLQRETGARTFAVQGNVDPYPWVRLFDGLDVTVVTQTQTFQVGGLHITCLGLGSSRYGSLRLSRPAGKGAHVVLGHFPNFALGQVDADLLVAGHTHGGQIRLPILGPLLTHSAIPHSWAAGATRLSNGGFLVVSRGIGMERENAPRFRFFCRPELAVIDLVPAEE